VLVFAALSVEGDFSNIFWSELHKVGSFDIWSTLFYYVNNIYSVN
jgi:hypothetical protein